MSAVYRCLTCKKVKTDVRDCIANGHRVDERSASRSTAPVPQELVSRILALCSYVGDHGGGERRRCVVAEACPSCVANKIADELAKATGLSYA